jgi:hypothetical protein
MSTAEALELSLLYERDETAWLEAMSALAADGRHAEMDYRNLSEYLADMALRDRREVYSRLAVLLTHILKWEHQPDRRSTLAAKTILEQRSELTQVFESGTLRNHAKVVLTKAYADARRRAAVETDLPLSVFPVEDARGIDDFLTEPDVVPGGDEA